MSWPPSGLTHLDPWVPGPVECEQLSASHQLSETDGPGLCLTMATGIPSSKVRLYPKSGPAPPV